jgi:hypothetical protein
MKLRYVTPMLAAAGAAAAIIAAPDAMASDSQSCTITGTGRVCESPGNVGHYDRGHR